MACLRINNIYRTTAQAGFFSIVIDFGSIVGAIIVQTLNTTIWSFNVPPEISKIVIAIVVIFVSLLQSARFRSMFLSIFNLKAVQK